MKTKTMRTRISRQSIGRRRTSLANMMFSIFSRTILRGDNGSAALCVGRVVLLLATILFVISSDLLIRMHKNGSHKDRSLSSAGGATKPTRAPLLLPEPKPFQPTDFRRKNITLTDSTVVLFYNLFIPREDKGEGVKHAMEVIAEQISQVASSLRRLEEARRKKQSASLFYNMIGNEDALSQEKMQALCNSLHSRLSCRQLAYYETASESVTLQDIYDFCQNDDAADVRVTYIHSKGSYHQSEVNTHWRRAMTDAVVHPHCLFPPDGRCNVCGAQFYTRFATIYPGNMWTAKCSYVKRLLPPLEGGEYDHRKKESVIKFLKYRLYGQLQSTLLEDRVDYFGLGRYRLEHWIGSHPSIQPCELHRKNVTFDRIINGRITPNDYEWGKGPRRNEVVGELPEARRKIKDDKDAQFREYFFLPGNLLKWIGLYGKDGVPSKNSWAWKFFPGGDKWKRMVIQYGENAVEEMVLQSSKNGFHSAYPSPSKQYDATKGFQIDPDDEKNYFSPSDDSSGMPPLVVFYHISLPKENKLAALYALKSQLEVLTMGQYDIISRSYHPQRHVMLYYTVSGNSTDLNFFRKTCAHSKRLTCRKLGELPSAKTNGETLHHLHNFCVAKPSHRVTYLSNTLPQTYGVEGLEAYSMQKIRAYTTAVTSKMCLKSRDTCNVCGVEFYPLPYHHFVGNTFTASCDYVKELIPPQKFEKAMNDIGGETLVSQLRRAVTTELFPFTPQNLGLDQYSIEHWIGSHPDLSPCDVAPVRHSWLRSLYSDDSYVPNDYTSSRSYDFMWSQAPRRSSAPYGKLDHTRERKASKEDDIVFREYYYLAGNLHRWYKLYNKAPPWDSWVWSWYPKGEQWMIGAKRHDSEVVTKLSKQYWDEGVPF